MLVNLLENALKYTPAGTPIEVSARVEGDWLTIEVADRGPGLAGRRGAARLREVLPARRGERQPGAGLGLTIAGDRRGARGQDRGREPARRGRGVPLTLPLGGPPPELPAEAQRDARSPRPARRKAAHMVSAEPLVLVVDDEAPIRRFLRASLAGDGYRVVEAATARRRSRRSRRSAPTSSSSTSACPTWTASR